jgi:ribosomal protein L32E
MGMIHGMKVQTNRFMVYRETALARPPHRKKRIDKKWRKRYGYKVVEKYDQFLVMRNIDPWTGKTTNEETLICHPEGLKQLQARLEKEDPHIASIRRAMDAHGPPERRFP